VIHGGRSPLRPLAAAACSGTRTTCRFVPERDQHHGADGYRRINDRGEIQAVVRLYPMICIKSRSARKLMMNTPTPMVAAATGREGPAESRHPDLVTG
jgi:hypothetical protein